LNNQNFTETEFFECACQSRDHLLIVKKDIYFNKEIKDISISLNFVATRSDLEATYIRNFYFLNFLKRSLWRIKEAFSILIKGKYKVEDCWEPLHMNKDENIVGISETRRLGETLLKYSNDVEKFINNNI